MAQVMFDLPRWAELKMMDLKTGLGAKDLQETFLRIIEKAEITVYASFEVEVFPYETPTHAFLNVIREGLQLREIMLGTEDVQIYSGADIIGWKESDGRICLHATWAYKYFRNKGVDGYKNLSRRKLYENLRSTNVLLTDGNSATHVHRISNIPVRILRLKPNVLEWANRSMTKTERTKLFESHVPSRAVLMPTPKTNDVYVDEDDDDDYDMPAIIAKMQYEEHLELKDDPNVGYEFENWEDIINIPVAGAKP